MEEVWKDTSCLVEFFFFFLIDFTSISTGSITHFQSGTLPLFYFAVSVSTGTTSWRRRWSGAGRRRRRASGRRRRRPRPSSGALASSRRRWPPKRPPSTPNASAPSCSPISCCSPKSDAPKVAKTRYTLDTTTGQKKTKQNRFLFH